MKNTVKFLSVIISLLMIFTMVSCNKPSAQSIEITEPPEKTSFLVGNVYHITDITMGMEIKVTNSDGTSNIYNSSDDWEFFVNEIKFNGECIDDEGYVTPAMGKNVITLFYEGQSKDFTITGVGLENIEIIKKPHRTEFIANNQYSLTSYFSGLEVSVGYSDGSSRVYSYEEDFRLFESEFQFSGNGVANGFFTPSMGENVITVTHWGKSASFTVVGAEVESLEVTKVPDTKFIAGNNFYIYDFLDGMELRVNYTDKASVIYNYEDDFMLFHDLEFSGDCVNEAEEIITPVLGENLITIAFGDKTTNFKITGYGIEGIEVTKNPDRTEFVVNNEYYLSDYFAGMEVNVRYADGSEKLHKFEDDQTFFYDELKFSGESIGVDGLQFTPAPGENLITVACGEKTAKLTLTGLTVEGIEVTKSPHTVFTAGKLYDVPAGFKNLEVKVSYSNGTDVLYTYDDNEDFFMYELKYAGECVDEYGVSFTPVSGDNVITVECAGKTAEFTITAE